MKLKQFSIIVPFRNTKSEQFSKCLSSLIVLNDDLLKEIIVIDDASDAYFRKELRENISKINDSKNKGKIKIVTLPQNLGLAGARKAGYYESSGDYIMFVDSDDFINRVNTLDILSEYFIKNPDIEIIKSGYVRANNKRNIDVPSKFFEPIKTHFDADWLISNYSLLKGQTNAVWMYVFKREAIRETRFWNFVNKPFEDLYFLANTLHSRKMILITSETWYSYRENNPGSLIWQNKKIKISDKLSLIYDWFTKFNDFNIKANETIKKLWFLICCEAAFSYGYKRISKNLSAIPSRSDLVLFSDKFQMFSGMNKKIFKIMVKNKFLGWIIPPTLRILKIFGAHKIVNQMRAKH